MLHELPRKETGTNKHLRGEGTGVSVIPYREGIRLADGGCVTFAVVVKHCKCICKDHRNEIEAPDPVVKDLISNKIMKRFDKKARLINGTETTIFVKYPIYFTYTNIVVSVPLTSLAFFFRLFIKS